MVGIEKFNFFQSMTHQMYKKVCKNLHDLSDIINKIDLINIYPIIFPEKQRIYCLSNDHTY